MMFKLSSETPTQTTEITLNFEIKKQQTPQSPSARFGYDDSLNSYRNRIDNIDSDIWKKVRLFINDYDFLVKDPIINRAFYKYWEIINEFDIFEEYVDGDLVLHTAEAPGGFVQGSNIYLQIEHGSAASKPKQESFIDDDGFVMVKKKKKAKHDYKIYTISLNKDLPEYKTYNLPSYNKNIINKHVCITYGKDQTGDINNWENIEYIKNKSKKPFFLVTADGGFDEGTDFNNKEQLHYNLILSEIYLAIKLGQENGHFILKVFDIFTDTSMHLLYLLTLCFTDVYIYKPKTSRPTNSEKYVVCKYLKVSDTSKSSILDTLSQLNRTIKTVQSKYISFTLFDELPQSFVNNVYEMNSMLLGKQCAFLSKAVQLCESSEFLNEYEIKLLESIERRKQVFSEWEETYNLHSYV
jgi:23S rRNA U2552 (ribose-2'-O)-methylase RlmE/FtsJ